MSDSETTSGEENEILKIKKKRKVYLQKWKRQKNMIIRQNGAFDTTVLANLVIFLNYWSKLRLQLQMYEYVFL